MVTCLRGGLLVADAAIAVAIQLEALGHALTADGLDLFVSQPEQLTEDTRAAIRRWKWHLLAIATYGGWLGRSPP